MSVKTIGEKTVLILQPDQSVTQGPDGSVQAKLSYKCPWGKIAKFVPRPLQKHPIFPQLLLFEFNTVREPGDIGRFDLIYRGVLLKPEDLAKLNQEEAAQTVSTEPIETNPRYAGVRDANGAWPASPPVTSAELGAINRALSAGTVYTSANARAVELFTRKLRGLDSYYRVGTTYRNNYVLSTAPSAANWAATGKIWDTALMKKIFPNAPVAPTGQNYLMTGLSWRKSGGMFAISQEFQLSGRGGWDQVLYDTVTTAP
jgi:hypothetical protein